MSETEIKKTGKQRRGFAAMSEENQRRIASLGGKAAHAKGTAHEFTSEEARAAGRLGGLASQKRHQAEIVEADAAQERLFK